MKVLLSLVMIFSSYALFAQTMITDSAKFVSIRKQLSTATGTSRIDMLNELAEYSKGITKGWTNVADTQSYYAGKALSESEKIEYKKGISTALSHLGSSQWFYAIPLIRAKKPFDDVLKKGERFLLRAIPIAEELREYNLLGNIYETLSFQQYLYNDNSYKVQNFKKSAKSYHVAGNLKKEAEVTTWLCEDFTSRGAFEEGFEYCKKNLELAYHAVKEADTEEDRKYRLWHVWNAINNMSYVYELAGDYETAKKYIFRANDFTTRQYPDIKPDYNTLSNLNIKLGLIDSAKYYLKKSTVASWGSGNEIWYRITKARIFNDLNEPDSALATLKDPYEKYMNGKATWWVLLPLANAHHQKKNTQMALKLAQESLSKVGSDQRISLMNHYQMLAEINEAAKKYDSAYYFLDKYHQLKDSIFTRQHLWQLNNYKTSSLQQKRTAELAILQKDNLLQAQLLKHQLLLQQQNEIQLSLLNKDYILKDQQLWLKDQVLNEQQFLRQQKESALALLDNENKLKDQQLKQETTLRNALLGGLFLLLAIGVFIFRLITLKQKNERLRNEKIQAELQQQATELEMQALRAQMNPHFIFNCLSSINKFILKNESRAASDYLTRFSRLIRTVLTNSQLSKIPLADEIEMLRLYLDMERLRFNDAFSYNINFENGIEPESIYIPPMLLQPLCENAIWHGLMHKDGEGKLEINLSERNGLVTCIIKDNGIGREKAAELKSRNSDHQKSFGLKITTERLAIFNNNRDHNSYVVEDLFDDTGNASGTRITLKIRYKQYERIALKELA